jgi:Tol biopolymer transport system component
VTKGTDGSPLFDSRLRFIFAVHEKVSMNADRTRDDTMEPVVEDDMKKSVRIPPPLVLFGLVVFALACTCFSSGAASPPAVETAAGLPSGTAAVEPEKTPEVAPEDGDTPTAELHPPAFPDLADMGRIVFSSSRKDNLRDVFLMNADGSGVRFLAGTPDSTDLGAAWSPDGEWIAFIGSAGGTFDIQRIRPDGSELSNLTNTAADESSFDWSPDGSQIVFASNRGGDYDLYVMNADGSNVRPLTRTGDLEEVEPAWSPDGDAIGYLCGSTDSTTGDIYLMNADGSDPMNLTANDKDITEFAWSPDGSRLAFGILSYPAEIWMMNREGSGRRNMTNDPAHDAGFAFSPDGTMIAFSSDRSGGKVQIFLMNTDGSNVVQLTDNDRFNAGPVWSPDGTAIAFLQAEYQGAFDYEICIIRVDGSGLVNLTSDPAKDLAPDWEPL